MKALEAMAFAVGKGDAMGGVAVPGESGAVRRKIGGIVGDGEFAYAVEFSDFYRQSGESGFFVMVPCR